MRHVVNVMRPPAKLDERGQTQGTPETVIPKWPCTIKTLAGRKAVEARTLVAAATHEVTGYGDPRRPLRTSDYLVMGERRFEILAVRDERQDGVNLTLLCEEQVSG